MSVIKPTVKWTVLAVGLWLSGCSNHTPAPVTSLGKDYHTLERGSYRGSYYEVQKGDTLYFISYITDKDVNELIAYNRLAAPYTIYPGQKLQLWKPKYVAPQYGKTVPITPPVTQTAHKAKPVITPTPKPTPQPATKPAPQKPAPVAVAKSETVQKNSNKNIDPAPTKEYPQKAESNKVVTNKPKPTPKPSNTKVINGHGQHKDGSLRVSPIARTATKGWILQGNGGKPLKRPLTAWWCMPVTRYADMAIW